MNHRRMLHAVLVSWSLALLLPVPAHSALVPHHSFMVNNDGRSAECLACHDGASLHPVAICTVQCSFRDPHIIDTPYPPPDKFDSYVPPPVAESWGIRFPDGLVSCISCHNLLNPAPGHLAISNEGSRLCLACHIQ